METRVPIVILNEKDAKELGVNPLDRIVIKKDKKRSIGVVDTTKRFIEPGSLGLTYSLEKLKGKVKVSIARRPDSIEFIKKKLDDKELRENEITAIVNDINKNKLSDIELGSWMSGIYSNGMNFEETKYLTKAMVNVGERLNWDEKPIADKHSITEETPILIKEEDTVKVIEIGPFVDEIIESSDSEKVDTGGEYSESVSNYEVPVFGEDMKISFQPLTGVFRHPSPKTVREITLKNNRKVKVTDGHSLFVLRNGHIKSVPSNKLKEGDFVLVPRKPFGNDGSPKNISVIEFLKRKNIKTNDVIVSGASEELGETGYKKYQNIADIDDHSLQELQDKRGLTVRQKNGNNLPTEIEINENLMRFLGYYVAEGYTNEIGVFVSPGKHEEEFIEDIKEKIREVFNLEPTLNYPHDSACHVCIYNQLLARIFSEMFGCGKKAHEKRIPWVVFNSSKKMKLEFLKGYMRGDGYIRRNYEATAVTCSKGLARDLFYLLSSLGISYSITKKDKSQRTFGTHKSDIREKYYIYFQANKLLGKNSNSAAYLGFLPLQESNLGNKMLESERLGWEDRRKAARQKYLTYDTAERIFSEMGGNDADLERIIKGDLGFLEVKKIREINYSGKYVYDLCVKDYENFIAGEAPIFVHNSIGGVPGNRTTPIIVPIVASTGLMIPKTSSRAITSPAGTADTMEVFSEVEFSIKEIKQITRKTNGCIVWGGAVNLSPVDDKVIRAENPLSLDPESQLFASVLSKKKSAGSTHITIDIPYGENTKVENVKEAEELGRKFKSIGKEFGMIIECAITRGDQPIGRGIGPNLEAKDILSVLKGNGPNDLKQKSFRLSDMLLDLCKKKEKARKILRSGKALEKFWEIVKAQGGKEISEEEIPLGKFKKDLKSKEDGYIIFLDNELLSEIARRSGAPVDKAAGIYLHKKKGEKVEKGEPVLTIYSEKSEKLEDGIKVCRKEKPYRIGKKEEIVVEEL